MREWYTGRALTILQPSAEAIAAGVKLWENRPDPMPSTVRVGEWIALHAGVKPWVHADLIRKLWPACPPDEDLAWGSIFGLWRYDGCVQKTDPDGMRRRPPVEGRHYLRGLTIPTSWDLTDPFAIGPWCLRVGAVVRLPRPIPCRGFQGYWRIPADIRFEVSSALPAGVRFEFPEAA